MIDYLLKRRVRLENHFIMNNVHNNQINIETNKQTNKEINKHTNKEINKQIIDAYGNHHQRVEKNQTVRIVSLVPSLTELLFDLGLSSYLVGRTGFCVHPKEVHNIAKIGGTKNVNIEKIKKLAPTHLIVNIDENEKLTVEKLAQFIPNIIVTHPISPRDNLALFQLIGAIFNVDEQASRLCEEFENAYQQLSIEQLSIEQLSVQQDGAQKAGAQQARKNVLYCIWKDPWMSVSSDTYIAQMLALKNWQQVGLQVTDRYPVFEWNEQLLSEIDAVLLSTEPYRFTQSHVAQLQKEIQKPVYLVDGEMFSWYGSRSILGLRYLQNVDFS